MQSLLALTWNIYLRIWRPQERPFSVGRVAYIPTLFSLFTTLERYLFSLNVFVCPPPEGFQLSRIRPGDIRKPSGCSDFSISRDFRAAASHMEKNTEDSEKRMKNVNYLKCIEFW